MAELEGVKKFLRSLLISSKDGIIGRRLIREYKEMLGEEIPYKKFGFNTLVEFMRSMPDLCSCQTNVEGELVFMGVANEATAHIQRMIKHQRSKKKKPKMVRRPKPGYMSRPTYNVPSVRPARSRAGWPANKPPLPPDHSVIPRRRTYINRDVHWKSHTRPGMSPEVYRQVYGNTTKNVPQSHQRTVHASVHASGFEVPPRLRKNMTVTVPSSKPDNVDDTLAPSNFTTGTNKAKSRLLPGVPAGYDKSPPASLKSGKDFRALLHKYTTKMSMNEPKYETFQQKNGFYSYLLVNDESFPSRVNYRTTHEAEQAAAKEACEKLNLLDGSPSQSKNNSDDSSPGILENEDLVKARIAEVLSVRQNGLWLSRLGLEYEEKFKEALPKEALVRLDNWSDIARIESGAKPEMKILYPVPVTVLLEISSIEVPSEGSEFAVYLSYIVNPSEFFIQKEDSNVAEIQSLLKRDYQTQKKGTALRKPDIGHYCAALYEEEWYRAKIVGKCTSETKSEYDILYVDFGNMERLPSTKLLQLTEEQCQEPAQAIRCSLEGVYPQFEIWCEEAVDLIKKYAEDELDLTVTSQNDDCIFVNLQKKGDKYSLNEQLLREGLASPSPHIETEGPGKQQLVCGSDGEDNQFDVYVSLIMSGCEIIIRLIGENYSDKLDTLEAELKKSCIKVVKEVKIHQVYAVIVDNEEDTESGGKSDDTIAYNRVCVTKIDPSDPKQVEVEFLDHGGTENVQCSSLREIPNGLALNSLPYQAIQVSLDGMENMYDNQKVKQELVDKVLGGSFVATVMDRSDKISITLFDTSVEPNIMINHTITAGVEDTELTPRLPKVNSTIDGMVSHIEGDHFYFLVDGPGWDRLEKMGQEISKYYSQPASAVHFVSNLEVGKICVCKHSDGNWFRARIEKVLPSRKVEVFYVDYGNSDVLSGSNLRQPLPSNRLLTTLPHQAIKCKLFDLPPKGSMWTDEAVARFEQLISDKKVVLETYEESFKGSVPQVEIHVWDNDEMIPVSEILLSENVFPGQTDQDPIEGLQELKLVVDSDISHVSPTTSNTIRDTYESIPASSSPSEQTPVTSPPVSNHTSPEIQNASITSSVSDDNSQNEQTETTSVTNNNRRTSNVSTISDSSINVFNDKADISKDTAMTVSRPLSRGSPVSSDEWCYLPDPPSLGIPGVDEFWEVTVIWVFDPQNFRCIPYESTELYDLMRDDMNVFYSESSLELEAPRNIEKDHMLACFSEGEWHRVKVKSVLEDVQQVSVHFVDRGDFNAVQKMKLRPLAPMFRNSPFQAVKATLYGTVPASPTGWSSKGVDRFNELVLNRDFVSVIHGSENKVITLDLIDTSDQTKDIVIRQLLYNEGHAVYRNM